jgi:predicted RNase H-like nuclease (RuvC/YqgF family)
MKKKVFLVVMAVGLAGCAYEPDHPEDKTAKDLERAIQAIEDRRDAELRIIEEQRRMITVLEDNLGEAKSEGMRDKIRNEISEKRVTIGKAEVNLNNQQEILESLYRRRDSIRGGGE